VTLANPAKGQLRQLIIRFSGGSLFDADRRSDPTPNDRERLHDGRRWGFGEAQGRAPH